MKGWELLKKINNNEIKSGTHIKVYCRTLELDYWFWGNWFGKKDGYSKPMDNMELYLCDEESNFEIIEEQEEINIQDIEEFKVVGCNVEFMGQLISTESHINDMQINKINQIIKAIKQLDNKIKEE